MIPPSPSLSEPFSLVNRLSSRRTEKVESFFVFVLLFLPLAKVADLSIQKLSVSISRVSVEGLKLVTLSIFLILNFDGCVIGSLFIGVSLLDGE